MKDIEKTPIKSIDYIQGLDGLRAISMFFVIIFHYAFLLDPELKRLGRFGEIFSKTFSIGWIGVDVFLVISGFLICKMLQKTRGEYSIKKHTTFISKRLKRLLPAYFFLLLFFFIIINTFTPDSKILNDYWSLCIFTSNVIQPFTNRAAFSDSNFFLGHLWSVSLEIHFYIMVSTLFLFIKSIRKISIILIMIAVLTRVAIFTLSIKNSDFIIYSITPCRIDAFAIGCYLSTIDLDKKNIAHRLYGIFGLLSFLILMTVIANTPIMYKRIEWLQTIGYTAIDVSIGLSLLGILSSRKSFLVKQVLECNFLKWVGVRSYSMYLWHLPVMPLIIYSVRNLFLSDWKIVTIAIIAGLLSTAFSGGVSYYFLERNLTRRSIAQPQNI